MSRKIRKPIAIDFGNYLKTLRVEREIARSKVAKALNLSIVTIKYIEQGINPPPKIERLRLWLSAIGASNKFTEAAELLRSVKLKANITYVSGHPANEHIDRILEAYNTNTLTEADINLLRMVSPRSYERIEGK